MEKKPFYTLEHGGQSFTFRRPTVDQINRLTARISRVPVSAAIEFTAELAEEPEAWKALLEEKPGLALQAANGILELLGFPTA